MKNLSSILTLALALPATAAVVVTEDFTYANGDVEGLNGGTGFSGAWSASDSATSPASEFDIVGNQALFQGYQGASQEIVNQTRDFSSSYTLDDLTTITFSFDLIVNETQLGRGIGVSLFDTTLGQGIFFGKQINGEYGAHDVINVGSTDYANLSATGSMTITAILTSDGTDTFVSVSDGTETVNGTVAGTQFTFDQLQLNGYHRLTTSNGVDSISLDVTTIPEPSSTALLGLAGLGLLLRRRK